MKQQYAPGWHDIQQRSRRLRREAEDLIAATLALAQEGDPLLADPILAEELPAWQAIAETSWLTVTQAADAAHQTASTAAETFTANLKAALATAGITAYGDGSFIIADGIVHLTIDTAKGSLSINGHDAGTFDIPRIVVATKQHLTELSASITPPDPFLAQLRTAYDLQCLLEQKQPGTQLQTLTLLPHIALLRQRAAFRNNPIKEQYQAYPFHVFRADLYTLLQAGPGPFHYSSGSDTKGAVFMLVPALGRTAHVGRVWFEAAQ